MSDTVVAAAARDPSQLDLARRLIGTPDVGALAGEVARFVAGRLGSAVERWEFVVAGAASTHGLVLRDGRRVVAKAHPPGPADLARLDSCVVAQRHLHGRAFPCPEPLAGPVVLGAGYVTAEAMMAGGRRPDRDAPETRRLMAGGLAGMVGLCEPLVHLDALDAERLGRFPLDPLWPETHVGRLDLRATSAGAEWIDALGREARRRRYSTPIGQPVVGHNDWRVEHVRVDDAGRIVATFDWDSVVRTREPLLVASSMRGFTADWSEGDDPVVPTLDQAMAFVDDYEQVRGARFNASERALIYAGWIDALAYAARCEHAVSPGRVEPGGFRDGLARAAPALLGMPPPPGTPHVEPDLRSERAQ